MDCDASVVSNEFLSRYMAVRNAAEVVYGGLVHPEQLPSPKVFLAFFYEKHAEPHFTAEKTGFTPLQSLLRTFNFMILRETFLKHPFDETITHYGHEDTLFGLVLKKKEGIKICI